MSKLSSCHASLLESYLSVKLAICQSYLFVMLATCHSYMSKQLAHLVPVLRKFLVKLPLNKQGFINRGCSLNGKPFPNLYRSFFNINLRVAESMFFQVFHKRRPHGGPFCNQNNKTNREGLWLTLHKDAHVPRVVNRFWISIWDTNS